MKLSERDKERIIDTIRNGGQLEKEDIYKLFNNEEDVFLFWNGRNEEVTKTVLPFEHVEIN
jgi:hypothetical protein